MKTKLIAVVTIVLLASCVEINETSPKLSENMDQIEVPEGFDFRTSDLITIKSTASNVKHSIYSWREEQISGDNNHYEQNLVATLFGGQTLEIEVPRYMTHLYVVTNNFGNTSSDLYDITATAIVEVNYDDPNGRVSTVSNTDSDGDGVADEYDEFPSDPNKASIVYSPSSTGYNLLLFEDNWPSRGDYDFNDVVLKKRTEKILNADGDRVEEVIKIVSISDAASYKNGIGVHHYFSPSNIASLDRGGIMLTEGYISETNGVEDGHSSDAVVILTDNHDNLEIGIEYTFIQTFVSGAPSAYSNTFLIVDKKRGYELKLPNHPPTNKVDISLFGTMDDNSSITNPRYKDSNGFSWALNLSQAALGFKSTLEGITILEAYPQFEDWVESGGSTYTDWYLHPVAGKVVD